MKKVALIISVDYELFGDGSGEVTREQIDPTLNLATISREHGAKLSVLFEYGQYCAYEKFASKNTKLGEDNAKIREQLVALVKEGHDVQLHYHAQWEGAVYDTDGGAFSVNFDHVDISSLPYERVVSILSEGKAFLEELIRPYKSDYECLGFRAGSWAVKDQKKLLDALRQSGFKSDTSVVPNTVFESEFVNFAYKDCPHHYHYWYPRSLLSDSGSGRDFVEIPLYTIKHPLAFMKYFNDKYLASRKIVSKLYETKISEKNFSLFHKMKKILNRDYYMADLNTMSHKTLIKMVEDVLYSPRFEDEKVVPLMLICHSKTSYELDDLHLFFKHLNTRHKGRVEYWTYEKAVTYLTNTKEVQ